MKKTISLFVCLALLLGASSLALYAETDWSPKIDGKVVKHKKVEELLKVDLFNDINDYKVQYYGQAVDLWKKNLLKGSNGHFNLDQPINRAEGTIMIVRLLGLEDEALLKKMNTTFTDLPDWAKYHVAYATNKGITQGISNTEFGPFEPLTANQFITMVLRALGYDDTKGDFVWNKAADKAYEIMFINGTLKTKYTRTNIFLRDDVAYIINKALDELIQNGYKSKDKYPDVNSGEAPMATAAEVKNDKHNAGGKNKLENNIEYKGFDVLSYKNVDPNALEEIKIKQDNYLYIRYKNHREATFDYCRILENDDFEWRGNIKLKDSQTGEKEWKCDWYAEDDLNVVCGKVGEHFIVAIYNDRVNDNNEFAKMLSQ